MLVFMNFSIRSHLLQLNVKIVAVSNDISCVHCARLPISSKAISPCKLKRIVLAQVKEAAGESLRINTVCIF